MIFIGAGAAFGRPLLTAPDVPPDRVQTLREAFDRTMTDPVFQAGAAKLNMDIKPLGGAELQRIATMVVQSKPEELARAKELICATKS